MALVTIRFVDIREGLFTVDITYEESNDRIERVIATCNNPNGVYVALHKGQAQSPWRETTLANGEVFDESRPFGGGFNTLADLYGIEIRLVI